MIRENLLPGSRVYRYNYVKDNCATSARHDRKAATDRRFEFGDTSSGITYRDEMRFNHRYYPCDQFGQTLHSAGLTTSLLRAETAFSPLRLQKLSVIIQPHQFETHVHGTESLSPQPDGALSKPTPYAWIIFV